MGFNRLGVETGRNHLAALDLAVELDDDFNLIAGQGLLIDLGPGRGKNAGRMAQILPQFLGHVGGKGRNQNDQRLDGFPIHRPALFAAAGVDLHQLDGVHEFHDLGDGGIELECTVKVMGDLSDALVEFAVEAALRRLHFGKIRLEPPGGQKQILRFVNSTPDTAQEAGGALHGGIVPLGILLRRADEQGIEPHGIGAILADQFVGGNDVTLRLRHLVELTVFFAALADHSLGEQRIERLAERAGVGIMQYLEDEA